MAPVENFRSPYDRKLGDLHHLGRMVDKIRLMQAGKLPQDYHRNYGLSVGLDGMLCGFLNIKFEAVEARVREGMTDEQIGEWIFSHGLRPNRMQAQIWNECSRKFGWNDRVAGFVAKVKGETGPEAASEYTSFDLIEVREGRVPPPARG